MMLAYANDAAHANDVCYASSKQTAQQKGFASKSFKCCFVGFSSSPKSFLRNTFRGPHLGLANIASLRVKRATSLCFSIASLRHRRNITKKSSFAPQKISFYLHLLENLSTIGKIEPPKEKLTNFGCFRNCFPGKNNLLELFCFFSYNN